MYAPWPDQPYRAPPHDPLPPQPGRRQSQRGRSDSGHTTITPQNSRNKPSKRKGTGGQLRGGDQNFQDRSHRQSPSYGMQRAAQPNLAGVELLLPNAASGLGGIVQDDRAWSLMGRDGFPDRSDSAAAIQQSLMGGVLRGPSPDLLTNYPPVGAASTHLSSAQTSPIPSRSAESSFNPSPSFASTPVMYRSLTLDSAARSSLLPYESTHLNRNMSRSPLLRQVSPSPSLLSLDTERERQGGGRRGPPKAILGGPGGKTYDELRGGSRIVSAPSRTPPHPPTLKLGAAPVEDPDKSPGQDKPPMWNSKRIEVRLPSSSKQHPSPADPPAAGSPMTGEAEQIEEEMKPMVNGKEVVVSMPTANSWSKLSATQSAFDPEAPMQASPTHFGDRLGEVHTWRITTANIHKHLPSTHAPQKRSHQEDPTLPAARHLRQPLDLAQAFRPKHTPVGSIAAQIGHYESANPRPGPLRPLAPAFEPDPATRRVVSLPQDPPSVPAEVIDPHSRTRRAVSDFELSTPSKRLRPDAAPFQPTREGSSSSAYTASPQKRASSVFGSVSETFLPSDRASQSGQTPVQQAATLSGDGARSHANVAIPRRDSVASTHSSAMKRSFSGRLRPVAPSFVPSGAFTFRPTTKSDAYTDSKGSSEAATHEGREGDSAATSPARISDTGINPEDRAFASPTALLHALPTNDEISSGSTQSASSIPQQMDDLAEDQLSGAVRVPMATGQAHLDDMGFPDSGKAHLPTDSFGLSSPQTADETTTDLPTARPPFSDSRVDDYFGQYNDVFVDRPSDQNQTLGLGLAEDELYTPLESAPPTHRGSTAEPYETVDGSPLLPRRHLETPATPVKDAAVESQVPILISPTPARRHRSRPSLLSDSSVSDDDDATNANDLAASRESLVPVFEQPGITVDEVSDDRRFRDWIYPASPERRPSITRRFTFPAPSGNRQSLAGVASTWPNAGLSAASQFERGAGLLEASKGLPTLSTRTSVEFPLRPKETVLKVANTVPGEGVGSAVNVDGLRSANSVNLESSPQRGEEPLQRLESLLQVSRAPSAIQSQRDMEVVTLGEQLSGMIAEMRSSLEDRLSLAAGPVPDLRDLRAALQKQTAMLAHIQRSGEQQSRLSDDVKTKGALESLQRQSSTLVAEHSAFLGGLAQRADRDLENGRQIQAVQEMLESLRVDTQLRRESEEKKDEVIATLRQQVSDTQIDASISAKEKVQLASRLADIEVKLGEMIVAAERTRDELAISKLAVETAKARTSELEAVHMAVRSERDGLAAGVRESISHRQAMRAEIENLRHALNAAESRATVLAADSSSSAEKLDAIGRSLQDLQASLAAQVVFFGTERNRELHSMTREIEGLKEDKRALQAEVVELRKKTYESASKIADADLRLAMAVNEASRMESTMRASLEAAEQAKAAAEVKVSQLQADTEALRFEKTNMATIAAERSGAMRLMEIRHQALIQENVFWREFALSYDRREYRKYTQSQPFRRGNHEPIGRAGDLAQEGSETVIPSRTPQTPVMRNDEVTPGPDQTPDLTMSTSVSSDEGSGVKG